MLFRLCFFPEVYDRLPCAPIAPTARNPDTNAPKKFYRPNVQSPMSDWSATERTPATPFLANFYSPVFVRLNHSYPIPSWRRVHHRRSQIHRALIHSLIALLTPFTIVCHLRFLRCARADLRHRGDPITPAASMLISFPVNLRSTHPPRPVLS